MYDVKNSCFDWEYFSDKRCVVAVFQHKQMLFCARNTDKKRAPHPDSKQWNRIIDGKVRKVAKKQDLLKLLGFVTTIKSGFEYNKL